MIYILNESIKSLLSDIELSEIQRIKMFKKAGYKCRILTLNYDENGSAYAKKHKIKTFITNMFDFFQNVPNLKKPNPGYPTAYDLGLERDHTIIVKNGLGHVMSGDREDAQIIFTDNEQVSQINWYDKFHQLVKTDVYDCRGFKARELYYGNQGLLNQAITYDYKGNPVITENYSHDNQQNTYLTMIDVVYQGKDLNFRSYNELFAYFVEQLMKKDQDDKFQIIAERPSMYEPLMRVKGENIKKLYVLYQHTTDQLEPMDAPIDYNFNYLLQNKENVDGIIVSTKQHKQDIKKWASKNGVKLPIPIYNASLGVVSDSVIKRRYVPISERAINSFASVMAFYRNRHAKEMIRAFRKVVDEYSNAHLDIYGYGDNNYRSECLKLIKDLNLTENVNIYDEANNLDNRLTDIIGYIDIADMDVVQPLGVMLALAHGTPVIARNMKYGTKELVRSGVNGYLMSSLNEDILAEHMLDFIKDQTKLQQLSDNAQKRIRHFDEEAILKEWKKVLD